MLSGIRAAFSISGAATLVFVAIGSGQAQDKPAATLGNVRAAIEASNKRYSEAVVKKDAAMIAAMYTPDALNFLPNAHRRSGSSAVDTPVQPVKGRWTCLRRFGRTDSNT